ncbi:hypothetical protein GWI33_015771 [Rhynchophorus ferrugineus]|uniref:Uncharacterized protein n=1 Tax=Rhynchophorus ferrugineus TaxID=354439 RepID=A0A834I057_RHYFE|nr:hypothetical protein GWI33_015771 [Rhynchophorus ferrugineus]
MAIKFIILSTFLAYASAGSLLSPAISYTTPTLAYTAPAAIPLSYSAPAITSHSSNIYRSPGNLGQISTYSKSIDTPFSSVRKADVRISNPGVKITTSPAIAYSAPTIAATYTAPTAYAAHAPLIGVAYSAAPAVAHVVFDSDFSHYAW